MRVERVFTLASVVVASQPADDEGSSLLQFQRVNVQRGQEEECLGGKCKPKTTTTTTTTCSTTRASTPGSCADYTCPLGFNLVSMEACASSECTSDECCEQNPSCGDFQCPQEFHSTSSETCDSASCSRDECCARNSACDDFQCPTDFHALKAAPEVCASKDCKQGECCGKNPSCDSHKCPDGFHQTSTAVCGTDECSTEECCSENPSCADYTCPDDFHPISAKVCDTEECTTRECCAKNGACDAFQCPDGFHMLATAPEVCDGKECEQDECCGKNPSCDSHECPIGFHQSSTDVCDRQECTTDECCAENALCADFKCPKGFNLVSRDSCDSKECTQDECCEENQSCGDYTCPTGFTSVSEAICNSKECTTDECCAEHPSCEDYTCPDDFHLSSSETCDSLECSTEECCDRNQGCDTYTCPTGFHTLEDASEVCEGKACKRRECCGRNPTCEFHECPTGHHQTSTAVCGSHVCSSEECCGENPSCADYECPDHHISTSTDTCSSEKCTTEECCEERTTTTTTTREFYYCDDHQCPAGYEKNLRRNACDGGACSDSQCCDKQVVTTTTTTKAPPPPPPAPAPCGKFTCPAGQQNMCAGQGGNRLLSRHKPVAGSCESRWGSFREVNDGGHGHWHACDGTVHNSWLQIDLQGEYAVGHMTLTQGNHFNYGYRQLTIERSTNGHQWYHVRTDHNGHCAPGALKNHAGWSQPTRFVRVKFGGLCAGGHFAIREWEIFGEQANGCTADACCKVIPPPPPPSCMGYQCPAGFMRSNTGICEGGTCSAEKCCEEAKFGPRMTCKVFGDPHVETFDGVYAERLGEDLFLTGDFYLVNSPNVQIQGRLTYSAWPKSSVAEIMMKGDALMGKILHIHWDGTVQWGHQRIGHSFSDDVISVNGGYVRFLTDPSVEFHFTQRRAGQSGLLDLNIFMAQRPGVRGFCGNMNGNQRDDGQFVNHRSSQVPGGQSFWAHPKEVEVKPPEKKCEGELKQEAEFYCHTTRNIRDKRSDKFEVCVFDYCIGGEEMAGAGLDFVDDEPQADGKGGKGGKGGKDGGKGGKGGL